ncbi:hypothetical protein RI065_11410 [Mycoplasmatota bacterium zrk1]
MERKRILITAAGSEIANPVIKALKMSDLHLDLIGVDIEPFSSGLFKTNKSYLVPRASSRNYVEVLKRICKDNKVNLIIPGSDVELSVLSQINESGLFNSKIVVSSPEVISITRDKKNTYEFFKQFNLPFVMTTSYDNVNELINSCGFPIIAKPKSGSASCGVHVLFDYDEFNNSDWDNYVFQDFLVDKNKYGNKKNITISDCYDGGKLIQEKEISVQVNVSSTGELIGTFISENTLKAGMPVKIYPFKDKEIEKVIKSMANKLIDIGLRGPCNFQCKLTCNGLYVFEINPRFTGITGVRHVVGYKECVAAVCDYVFDYSKLQLEKILQTDYNKVISRFYDEVIFDKSQLIELEHKKVLVNE